MSAVLLIIYYLLVLLLLIFIGLLIGMIGFYFISGLSSIDCFYSSAMYLTGLGIVEPVQTPLEKVFASFYSILSAFIFIGFIVFFVSQIAQLDFSL